MTFFVSIMVSLLSPRVIAKAVVCEGRSIRSFGLKAVIRCDCDRRLVQFCTPMTGARDEAVFRLGGMNSFSLEIRDVRYRNRHGNGDIRAK